MINVTPKAFREHVLNSFKSVVEDANSHSENWDHLTKEESQGLPERFRDNFGNYRAGTGNKEVEVSDFLKSFEGYLDAAIKEASVGGKSIDPTRLPKDLEDNFWSLVERRDVVKEGGATDSVFALNKLFNEEYAMFEIPNSWGSGPSSLVKGGDAEAWMNSLTDSAASVDPTEVYKNPENGQIFLLSRTEGESTASFRLYSKDGAHEIARGRHGDDGIIEWEVAEDAIPPKPGAERMSARHGGDAAAATKLGGKSMLVNELFGYHDASKDMELAPGQSFEVYVPFGPNGEKTEFNNPLSPIQVSVIQGKAAPIRSPGEWLKIEASDDAQAGDRVFLGFPRYNGYDDPKTERVIINIAEA
jgi:hypothetical protein